MLAGIKLVNWNIVYTKQAQKDAKKLNLKKSLLKNPDDDASIFIKSKVGLVRI